MSIQLTKEQKQRIDWNMILTQKSWVLAIAMSCSLLWGSAFPVIKISYVEMEIASTNLAAIIVFAGMRFFMASIILFSIVHFGLKQSIRIEKKNVPYLFLLGILQTTLQYFFFYNGLANTSGMKASILSSIGTLFIVILAHYFYSNDKMSLRKAIGLITGFTGIILVNWGNTTGWDSSFSLQGEGFMIISGIVGAFAMILAKKIAKEGVHPFLITGWQMLIGSSVLLLVGVPILQARAMIFTTRAWALLIYSSFLSAAAFSLWYTLLKFNKAGEISLYQFAIPIWGAILSTLIIPGERLSLSIVGALVLASAGIIVVNYDNNSQIHL